MNARTAVSNVPALSQFVAADGKMVASIIESAGGYRFVEERELWQPSTPGLDGYSYWAETEHSGIFASQEDALVAAKFSIDWLSDLRDPTGRE